MLEGRIKGRKVFIPVMFCVIKYHLINVNFLSSHFWTGFITAD